MSDKITLGNLRIKCRFPVITLLKCRIHSSYGEHIKAEIECIVKGSEIKKRLADIAEEKLEIVCEGEKEERIFIDAFLFMGAACTIFAGVDRYLPLITCLCPLRFHTGCFQTLPIMAR